MVTATLSSWRRLDSIVVHRIPAALRITLGLLWLTNLAWKSPPNFGEDGGGGLFGFTMRGIEHPIFPPHTWVLENIVLPNFVLFGWLVLLVETSLAATLLSGTFTRVAALVGAAQSAVIGLTVAGAPEEWGWSYNLMIAVHLAIFAMPADRVWAVDGLRSKRGTEAFPPAVRAGRAAVATGMAGYGVLVVALALDRPFVGTGATNLGVIGIQGSAALGVLLVLVGGVVFATAGRPPARLVGLSLLALAAAAVAAYGSDLNVLSAGPTTAAILAGGAAFLLASAPRRA